MRIINNCILCQNEIYLHCHNCNVSYITYNRTNQFGWLHIKYKNEYMLEFKLPWKKLAIINYENYENYKKLEYFEPQGLSIEEILKKVNIQLVFG